MKRKLVMLLTIVAVLAVGIGIWYNVPINLMDLEHDEVIEIVVFNGNTGNATHITDETQIEHNSISVLPIPGVISASSEIGKTRAIAKRIS